MLDSKSQLTLDIITKVCEGKITIINAAKLLSCSRRTIERYLADYQKVGIAFVVHGNTGKVPVNKKPNDLKIKVQSLIKEKYYDVNLQHLSELLFLNEGLKIKRETLRTWAHQIHHVKRAKKRRSQVRKRRERMESPGLMLQMDGSPHRWFGNKKSCLIAMIDDDIFRSRMVSPPCSGALRYSSSAAHWRNGRPSFSLVLLQVVCFCVRGRKACRGAKAWRL